MRSYIYIYIYISAREYKIFSRKEFRDETFSYISGRYSVSKGIKIQQF